MVGFIVLDIGIRVSTWSWHRAVSMPYFGGLTVGGMLFLTLDSGVTLSLG